jgi:hypothetical protein
MKQLVCGKIYHGCQSVSTNFFHAKVNVVNWLILRL